VARRLAIGGARARVGNPWTALGLGLVTIGITVRFWEHAVERGLRDAARSHAGAVELDPALSLLALASLRPPAATRRDAG
jgi:hypothetical protein